MKVGTRVFTPHGPGTILGFEQFDSEGMSLPIRREGSVTGSRVVVELDNPHNWAGHAHCYPHYWPSELKSLNDTMEKCHD